MYKHGRSDKRMQRLQYTNNIAEMTQQPYILLNCCSGQVADIAVLNMQGEGLCLCNFTKLNPEMCL